MCVSVWVAVVCEKVVRLRVWACVWVVGVYYGFFTLEASDNAGRARLRHHSKPNEILCTSVLHFDTTTRIRE